MYDLYVMATHLQDWAIKNMTVNTKLPCCTNFYKPLLKKASAKVHDQELMNLQWFMKRYVCLLYTSRCV